MSNINKREGKISELMTVMILLLIPMVIMIMIIRLMIIKIHIDDKLRCIF